MRPPVLVAGLREREGSIEVLAPAVGWWSGQPRAGAVLVGGSRIGWLEVLNRRYELALPPEAIGVVSGDLPEDRRVAVEFGGTLLALRPLEGRPSGKEETTATEGDGPAAGGEGIPVVSPTDGVFYRRPSPDEPPFVEVGSHVHHGQAVGLVEAMKTFNQIVFEGEGAFEEGEIAEILCVDAEEVRAGQVLMRVRQSGPED